MGGQFDFEEPCVIERLMGIGSRWTQQPAEKCRVFSDKYIQQLRSVGLLSQRGSSKNRVSWMETDGDEKGCAHECELSCVPYLDESSGNCPSTSNGGICLSSAENDTMTTKTVKGKLDSFRLIKSLQEKPHRVDRERKSLSVNNPQSFRFRRRIYMDPDKDVAAHTRHLKEKMKRSSSGPEDFTEMLLLLQSHIDHQRVRYHTLTTPYIADPCLSAMQALKDSRKKSKVSKYDQKSCSDIALSVSTSLHPVEKTDAVDPVASSVADDRVNHQDTLHALPGTVFYTLLVPENLSPRSSEEACQHSPVSVLQSSPNAGVVSDSDHFMHFSAKLQELRMHLQDLDTEFPEGGLSESSIMPFLHNEDKQEEVWAQLTSLKHEAMEIMHLPRKEMVRDSRWLDLAEEIQAIGTELETLLIDELIEDFHLHLSSWFLKHRDIHTHFADRQALW